MTIATVGEHWRGRRGWLYGLEVYVYGFPLMMIDLTKEAATAVPTAGEFTAPARCAVAWADLDQEPIDNADSPTQGQNHGPE